MYLSCGFCHDLVTRAVGQDMNMAVRVFRWDSALIYRSRILLVGSSRKRHPSVQPERSGYQPIEASRFGVPSQPQHSGPQRAQGFKMMICRRRDCRTKRSNLTEKESRISSPSQIAKRRCISLEFQVVNRVFLRVDLSKLVLVFRMDAKKLAGVGIRTGSKYRSVCDLRWSACAELSDVRGASVMRTVPENVLGINQNYVKGYIGSSTHKPCPSCIEEVYSSSTLILVLSVNGHTDPDPCLTQADHFSELVASLSLIPSFIPLPSGFSAPSWSSSVQAGLSLTGWALFLSSRAPVLLACPVDPFRHLIQTISMHTV
ncbi:myb-like protein L-like [Dorcoceras hygrometricum]|uniref:Myb-like protein L-like n=1 Tax=Dorcoceras hygrometricum TaxID=472368 RepID=A0A2Z7CY88_9LAMI|nr:myb-like protein L-like [Dorcoceras hygrometricum]